MVHVENMKALLSTSQLIHNVEFTSKGEHRVLVDGYFCSQHFGIEIDFKHNYMSDGHKVVYFTEPNFPLAFGDFLLDMMERHPHFSLYYNDYDAYPPANIIDNCIQAKSKRYFWDIENQLSDLQHSGFECSVNNNLVAVFVKDAITVVFLKSEQTVNVSNTHNGMSVTLTDDAHKIRTITDLVALWDEENQYQMSRTRKP